MNKIKLFRFSLSILIFSQFILGCGKISQIEIGDIQSIQIKGKQENMLILEVKVPVSNPSSHKIKIQEMELKTFINNRYVGKIICDEKIIIYPKSEELYTLNLKIKIANIFNAAILLMNPSNQRIHVGLEGVVKAKTCLITKKIEIDEVRDIRF